MTRQVLDTISIDGRPHWLANLAPILPPGLGEEIGLELKNESTANYRGWCAHWKVERGRLFLAELNVFGYLRDRDDPEAWRFRHALPRNISFAEIFGTEPPIFASWVNGKLTTVCSQDDSQYRRDDFGVSGSHTRVIGVANGMVVSDETIANADWNPERSEWRQCQIERGTAIEAAAEIFERRQRAQAATTAAANSTSERVVIPPPLPRDLPNRAYLCHRGVDPLLVQAIAEDFQHVLDCDVIVQEGDGLLLSWPQFRALARKHLAEDCDFLIVLLNEHFPGPVYKQTFSIIENAQYQLPKARTEIVRVDDCEGVPDRYRGVCDVTPEMTLEQRRAAIEKAQGRPIR